MRTDITQSTQHIVDSYLATWNATDSQERSRLLDEHWSREVTYVDPLADVSGRDALGALVAGTQEQFPDFVFALVGEADAHHDQLRFRWGLGPAGSEPVVIGFDVVVLDEEGLIQDVRGFLDLVPA